MGDLKEKRGPDWVREFLVRWVMEMGAGKPINETGLINNKWYAGQTISVNHSSLYQYFDHFRCDAGFPPSHNATINQAGLDYIEGDEE